MCPEHITITENAIIPLKERVVDRFYDPVKKLLRVSIREVIMDRFTLKPMSAAAIPSAIAKAERYRLLNEPGEAESICLDVLQIDPHNEDARIMLLLALTDQFPLDTSARIISRATDLAASLQRRVRPRLLLRDRPRAARQSRSPARSVRRGRGGDRMASRGDGALRAG